MNIGALTWMGEFSCMDLRRKDADVMPAGRGLDLPLPLVQ